MQIRTSDDERSREVLHKPSMKTQANTSMSKWTLLRFETFILSISYPLYCRNSLYFISNTKNKVKHRKCHSDENKKSDEEHVALQLYLQSLNIMTKYWVEIYSLTNVYIGKMYGSNILYLNILNQTQQWFMGDQQSSKSSMLVEFEPGGTV